jgi:hypothetical protein
MTDAREYCCDRMQLDVTYLCAKTDDVHGGDPLECPDRFFVIRNDRSYGLLVHDGPEPSSVTVAHCPWCGRALPPSRWENGARNLDIPRLELLEPDD